MLALILLLVGCPFYGEDVASVSVIAPDWDTGPEGSCEDALSAADTQLIYENWSPTDEERPLWTPEVQSLGTALVYTKGESELLLMATTDAGVAHDWTHAGLPEPCPLSAWQDSCDVADCEADVTTPCAHLVQVPCEQGQDPSFIGEVLSQVLQDLPG